MTLILRIITDKRMKYLCKSVKFACPVAKCIGVSSVFYSITGGSLSKITRIPNKWTFISYKKPGEIASLRSQNPYTYYA
ncbi:MAG: hypothetical protein IIB05_03295 [Bacteroidetes bacterium]|nr:hypothetical protein [Bacteroidota bacterium]